MKQAILPKRDFQRDGNLKTAFADMTANPAFRAGAKAALLEYVYILDMQPDPRLRPAPDVMAQRIVGAKEFLHVLLNLGEEAMPVASAGPETLDDQDLMLKTGPPKTQT